MRLPPWPAATERLRAPAFAPLAPALSRLDPSRWPGHADLDALAAGVRTARGHALSFVPPAEGGAPKRPGYELHIARTGQVETRERNWHDLLNALAWIAYPRAKAAINARHAEILEAGGEAERRRRHPARDALTLFDEGGVVVAATTPACERLVRDFAWKALFWHGRGPVLAGVRFFAFGHSLNEKLLAPFAGVVAKTVFVDVDEDFLAMETAAQVARVDERLAAFFADRARFATPRLLPPMPAMGIPGWHPGTRDESFYDDTDHFRPGKTRGEEAARPT